MSTKIFPFQKKSDKSQVPALVSKGPKGPDEVIDHGSFDSLSYEIYKRGVIRITDSRFSGLVFKKDINLFETEVMKLDFSNMSNGHQVVIKGSGDNDNLVFSKRNGDIEINLTKREFAAIEKLRGILANGKEKLLGTKK